MVDFFYGVGCPLLTVALKANLNVKTLRVVDINSKVHLAARQYVAKKKVQFPHLLSATAIQGFDTRLPQDIRLISNTQMANLDASYGPIDLIGAGFPCQPFSAAGPGRGTDDSCFGSFMELVRLINWR